MSFLPLPISIGGIIILFALLYGIWLLVKAMNLVTKASNLKAGTMFTIIKIILVMILVAIIISKTK